MQKTIALLSSPGNPIFDPLVALGNLPLVTFDVTTLGLPALPDPLASAVTERAEGNALFAEELVSYLRERGALTVADGSVEYDPAAISSALPLSLQSLLAARVGRLSPERRAVLQAASAIGRRFDPDLLASATDSADEIKPALADMQELDLAHEVASTG